MDTLEPITAAKEFRKRALKRFLLGLLGCIVLIALFLGLSFAGYVPANPFMLIPAAIPFVYFCIGSIELISGRPYQQFARSWMALKGWQRGVLGTLIVIVAFIIIFGGVGLIVYLGIL